MDSRQNAVPNYYHSQDGEPAEVEQQLTTSLPFDQSVYHMDIFKNCNSTTQFSDGLHDETGDDFTVFTIDTINIWELPSSYDLGQLSYYVANGQSHWGGEEEWQSSSPQASTSRIPPLVKDASPDPVSIHPNHLCPNFLDSPTMQSPTLPWFLFEDEPYIETTVNPQDICDLPTAPPSIHHTVDEGKPIYEYRGSPSASVPQVPGELDSDYYPSHSESESEADEERASCDCKQNMTLHGGHPCPYTGGSSGPITHLDSRASSPIPSHSPLAAARGTDNDLQASSASSHEAASSSSSVIASARGIKRSREERDNNPEDIDIHGDHQITKRTRKDGHPQCPYSKCSAHFTEVKDRNRHVKSASHLNILKRTCPVPYCHFEGARPDVVRRHERKRVHSYDRSGHCTCGARACERARKE